MTMFRPFGGSRVAGVECEQLAPAGERALPSPDMAPGGWLGTLKAATFRYKEVAFPSICEGPVELTATGGS